MKELAKIDAVKELQVEVKDVIRFIEETSNDIFGKIDDIKKDA